MSPIFKCYRGCQEIKDRQILFIKRRDLFYFLFVKKNRTRNRSTQRNNLKCLETIQKTLYSASTKTSALEAETMRRVLKMFHKRTQSPKFQLLTFWFHR